MCATLKRAAVAVGLSFQNQHHPHIAHTMGHSSTKIGELTMWSKPNALASNLYADFGSPRVTENRTADFGTVPHSHQRELSDPPCCAQVAYEHRLQLWPGMLLVSPAHKNVMAERCITYFCLVLCTKSQNVRNHYFGQVRPLSTIPSHPISYQTTDSGVCTDYQCFPCIVACGRLGTHAHEPCNAAPSHGFSLSSPCVVTIT
jgi:hypothetical protein